MKVQSEMAGTLLSLSVKEGQSVTAGQEVAVMESMKMEVPVQSPAAGKVTKIVKKVGDFVNEGDVILELG